MPFAHSLPASRRFRIAFLLLLIVAGSAWRSWSSADPAAPVEPPDRSPVDVVLTPDEQWLLTANQTSHSVSLVRTATGEVVAEAPCGQRPSALALTPDGKRVLVSGTYSGEVSAFDLAGEKLQPAGSVRLGFEPRGIAIAPDGQLAYIALTTAHAVSVISVAEMKELARVPVARWPRYLALTADGRRLAVACSGDGGVAVVDTAARKMLYVEDFMGLNLGQMHVGDGGKHVYFPWITSRQMPTTAGNIRLGWVLGSRIARVRLDGQVRREAITLDPPGKAVSDPLGLALSPDEQTMVVAASGTHELLVYRMKGLPWQDYGGPGDHINPELLKDSSRFYRIELGGRPMAVRFTRDGMQVYIANYLANAVQVVDLESRKVTRTIVLGGPKEASLARRGEAIFYDGQRSLDQWYSCHSCHYEGHTNSVTMDTRNDGRTGHPKTVLSLRNVTRTGPWNWHGWQKDLGAVVNKSFVDSMQGKAASAEDLQAILAFLDTLRPPPNPYRDVHGNPTEAARRGEQVFRGDKADCIRCHSGPYFTDGKVHDVGLGKRDDVYKGFNPPSLLGVHDRMLYLHDGRSRTLEEVLRGPHSPAKVTDRGELTEAEMKDLIEYLKSL